MFARALIGARLAAIGRAEEIPSPSYTLVQTYDLGDVELWHADLYRLGAVEEIAELGLEDAFATAICVVEWADRLGAAEPARSLRLALDFVPGRDERAARDRDRARAADGTGSTAALDGGRGMSRAGEIATFLAAEGWGDARRAPLAGDASARRYERLRRGGRSAILMDVPPVSRARGRAVPRGGRLAARRRVQRAGGARRLTRTAGWCCSRISATTSSRGSAPRSRSARRGLYAAAIDLLADLQRRPPPTGGWTPPPYDMAVLLREARLVVEWYLPAATGGAGSAGARGRSSRRWRRRRSRRWRRRARWRCCATITRRT